MILPDIRDPRFILARRGGALSDADHRQLALWAADCAEHVLLLFEAERPEDARPRAAIASARAWARGEISVRQALDAAGAANTAARDLKGAARFAAYASAQAAAVAHVAAHELGAAAYAIKAARASANSIGAATEGATRQDSGGAAGRRSRADEAAARAVDDAAHTAATHTAAAAEAAALQAGQAELDWQIGHLAPEIRALVLDDMRLRDAICWKVFDAEAIASGKYGRV